MDFPAGIQKIAGDSPSGAWMNVFRNSGFVIFAALILLLELGCGDQYRPVANPVVGPGGQPQSTHYAYVVNNNPGGDSSTMQIDVSGDSVTQLQTTGLGSNFESFLSTSTAGLFVSNGGDDSVSEFSISQTGVVVTTNLLAGSHPVALSSTQGGVMYVLNSGANSTCPASGSISVINTSTVAVTATVCLATPPPNTIYGVNPIAMVQAPGGGRVFIVDQGNNAIWVYDPLSQTFINVLTVANGIGLNPVFITASADGAYIFVVTQGDGVNPGALNIISTGNFSVVPSVPLGVKPTFAYFDPTLVRLYVTNTGGNTVSVFDASNININGSPAMPLLGVTPVGTAPVSVTALHNGTRFFVANSGSNNVTDASATSFAVLNTIPLPTGANPVWIASEPTSSKVYVANQSSISIIQTVNDAITANVPAPAQNPNCTSSCALQQPVMIITD
jgi:DNA-binding beta-propeller fold protein YncE